MNGLHKPRLAMIYAAILILAACDSGVQPLAGSQVDADPQDAVVAQMDNSVADVSEAPAPGKPIIAETLPYAEVDDRLVYGHFAFPADRVDALPALIVIHGRMGLDDGTRSMTERIAAQGFVVLAVDLFGGETADDPNTSRDLMVRILENPAPANANIQQAYKFLDETAESPRIGALGWSFGGGWALNAAILFPDDLDAVVIYYGQVSTNEERLAPISAPILGLFGGDDPSVSVDTVRAFEAVLENLRKKYEIEIYPGVDHAFADPESANYDSDAAEKAWARMLKFLQENLVDDSSPS